MFHKNIGYDDGQYCVIQSIYFETFDKAVTVKCKTFFLPKCELFFKILRIPQILTKDVSIFLTFQKNTISGTL